MTAAAADINTVDGFDFEEIEIQLAASQTIYQGTLVARNTSGYAIPMTDTAGLKLACVSKGDKRTGVSTQVSGASDTLYIQGNRIGTFRFAASGLAITDIGKRVYASDDKTITTTPTNVFAGYLVGIDTASWGFVCINEATHDDDASATDEDFTDLPVAATTTIVVNTHVATDDDGFLVPANDATAVKYAGLAREGVANGSGADGALNCMVQQSGKATCVCAGALAIDVNRPIWVNTAAALSKNSNNEGLYAGMVVKYISATSVVVDIGAGVIGKCPPVVFVGIAAGLTIDDKEGVCMDADGFLTAMDDATAVSFWGIALNTVVNAGADGTVGTWVRRSGLMKMTATTTLAATDVGKEVWQETDGVTVTKVPGTKLVGIIDKFLTATSCVVRYKAMPIVGQRTDRQFDIHFSYVGATLNTVKCFEDREFARRYICLEGYCDVSAAPGGSDTLTSTLSDGTTSFAVPVVTSATHGELKTAQVPTTATMKAATDTDMTLTDGGTTSADPKGVIHCEAL